MSKEKKTHEKGRHNANLAFAGCLVVGLGLGTAKDNLVVGLVLGLGIGLIVMAIFTAAAENSANHS